MLAVVIVDACHAEFVLGWDADVRSPDHILIESQVAHLLRHSVRGELYAVVGEEIGDFLFVGLSLVEYDEVLIAIVFNLKDRLDVYKDRKDIVPSRSTVTFRSCWWSITARTRF